MDRFLAKTKDKTLTFWRKFIIIVSENERRSLMIAIS